MTLDGPYVGCSASKSMIPPEKFQYDQQQKCSLDFSLRQYEVHADIRGVYWRQGVVKQ